MTKEKEVAEMKNDFVSNVSHELRTPLASIKAYIEMLIDGEADDEKTKREFYEVIQNEANRLSRLIDNILNISPHRVGPGQDQQAAAEPDGDHEGSDGGHRAAGEAEAASRSSSSFTPVFYQTMADRDMLYQAVLNLLSNAVKYTPEGGHDHASRRAVDEAKQKVVTPHIRHRRRHPAKGPAVCVR